MHTDDPQELEQLLSECKSLLGEEPAAEPPMKAEDVEIDYEKFYDGEFPQDVSAPARPLTAYEQSKPAYQAAKRKAYALEKQAKREQLTQKPAEPQAQSVPSATSEEYANWLYEQGRDPETTEQRREAQTIVEQMTQDAIERPKRRKKGWLLVLLIAAIAAAVLMILTRCPTTPNANHERLPETATILLAGTDAGGLRTDTLMLMRISGREQTVRLVSIPRDTLVLGNYSVPKINSAYGYAGGGEEGMEELMLRVSQCIGFRPDGYILFSLEGFSKLVDAMGGVRYTVPMPMQYYDPAQDLSIDLKAGEQTLSGEQAMQLVRFRSGYAAADLERVSVQRSFLHEALRQWSSPLRFFRYPAAFAVLRQYCQSDLSFGNDLWLAKTAARCISNIEMQTLPGSPMMLGGGSYYVLSAEAVVETVNEYLNPFEEPIGISELTIRNG